MSHSHYITKIDKSIVYIDREDADKVRQAIQNQEDIWYKDRFIPFHQITDFNAIKGSSPEYGSYGPSGSPQLGSGWEPAAKVLLETGDTIDLKTEREKRAEQAKDSIRKTLKGLGDDDGKKLDYASVRKLALRLHGETVREWRLKQWEEFNENHPHPFKELEELVGKDRLN